MDRFQEQLPALGDSEAIDLPVCTATSAAKLTEAVINGPHLAIRQRIVHLFAVEKKRTSEVLAAMSEMLLWPQGLAESTKQQQMSRMIRGIVDDTSRKLVHSGHKEISTETRNGRMEWMEGEDMLIWSDDEAAYFLRLMTWKRMWRFAGRCNHERIAGEMNAYTSSTRFTKEKCMQRLLNVRHKTDTPIPTFEQATDDFVSMVRPVVTEPENTAPMTLSFPTPPVTRQIERRPGEPLHVAAARDVATRLAILATGEFATAVALAADEDWKGAHAILSRLVADRQTLQHWQPVQHELYALVLLSIDTGANRALAGKHLEFARRYIAEGTDVFSNMMMLPLEVAAHLTEEAADDGDNGRYERGRAHPRLRRKA
jgi:hypothetical protein